MTIKIDQINDGKVILRVNNSLDDHEKSTEFKDILQELYDRGERELVLDLNNVGIINSYGIGKILMFYKRFSDIGGHLYIKTPMRGMIKDVFETLMLNKLIKEYQEG